MFYEQKMTSLGALEFLEILENPGKSKTRPEEARKRPEEARKRPGRGQESRIWRKTARNAMFYEQKMTSLGAPEFLEILGDPRRIQEKSKKRPEEARKRPEEARRGPEKPEKGQKRPGRGQKRPQKSQESRIRRRTARNACFMNRKK